MQESELSADLIARAAAGDRAAQQRVLETHGDHVRRTLYSLVHSHQDLDDLQQNVFERIVTSLPRFRVGENVSTWIGGICVNVARKYFERRKVRSRTETVASTFDREDSRFVGGDAETRTEAREVLGRCERALEALSPTHRTVFTLCVLLGHTLEDAARMTRSALSTTRLRLYYARKGFAKAYQERA